MRKVFTARIHIKFRGKRERRQLSGPNNKSAGTAQAISSAAAAMAAAQVRAKPRPESVGAAALVPPLLLDPDDPVVLPL